MKPLLVKDLMKQLEGVDPELKVVTVDYPRGWDKPYSNELQSNIKVMEVRPFHNPEFDDIKETVLALEYMGGEG